MQSNELPLPSDFLDYDPTIDDSKPDGPIDDLLAEYLPILYEHDAPAHDQPVCFRDTCTKTTDLHRCVDCFGGAMWCKPCILANHVHLPFHRLERWSGTCFTPTSLTDAGFVLYLGHGGARCPSSTVGSKTRSMTLMTTKAIHQMNVLFCTCPLVGGKHEHQLLKAGLFPATRLVPQTAFSFGVLKHFHNFNLVCKTAANDYLKCLKFMTDSVLTSDVPVRTFPLLSPTSQC